MGSYSAHQGGAATWSEQFPIAQTINVSAGNQPLAITQGGSANGYVLYQASPSGATIDVQNQFKNNVTIAAPYVILRGFTLKGAQADAINLLNGAHHVVIDPFQMSAYANVGWELLRAVGLGATTRLRPMK